MAKQGQHKNDAHDPRISKGPNNPDKSVTITTGSVPKHGPARKPAPGKNDPPAQMDRNEWREDTREDPPTDTRARETRSGRSGSESNASRSTQGH
jgi:hypothetical protein